MKHSIKRVQSQAGLSFAEREDVRPKVKQKLLFLLVLLMTATTGAWAQEETLLTTITATGQTTYSESTAGVVTVSHDNDYFDNTFGWLWYEHAGSVTVEAKDGYTITRCVFSQPYKTPFTVSTAPFKVDFIETSDPEMPEFKQYLCQGYMDGVSSIEVYGYAPAAAPATYSVTLAEGTEDADKWSVKVGDGEAQKLPLEGLEGGEKITVTYSGERKVKSVKAVKKAAGKTVDLSTYSGDSYEVTEDVTFTGTTNNAISILYKGEGYEVTLDNVNAPKCFIAAKDDYYNINVKLKGTSRLMGIYTQNAYIIIGEAEAGGTVILVDEDIPLGSPGTTITINGGTVKAKSSSYSALDSSLEVNGGAVYLEAGEDNVASASASGSVTLYGWNGSAWETYSDHRYLSTDNSKAPSEWTW